MFGVADAVLELAVIGEQEQAFAVSVESSRRVEVGLVDKIFERLPSFSIGELAEDIEGFIEKQYLAHSKKSLSVIIGRNYSYDTVTAQIAPEMRQFKAECSFRK